MFVSIVHLIGVIVLATNCRVQASGWGQTVFSVENDHQKANPSSFSIPRPFQRAKRIAIIGAGPGGTSTAYFLSRAQKKLQDIGRGNEGFELTLFEKEERIGGRTAVVHPYYDETLPAIELGASIFADVNMNLKRIAQDFKLETKAKLGEDGTIGVWDGQQFLMEGLDNGWWNSARMFWRYGYSPITTQKVVKKIVDRFLQLYDPIYLHKTKEEGSKETSSGFPWSSIQDLAKAMELDDLAAQNAGDYYYSQGVGKLFTEEIIEAATLVNYGQEIYSIHGVGGGVSLAASGAVGITGGNYLIFEEFLGRCDNLKLRLGVHGEVTGLARFKTVEDAIQAGKLSREEATSRGHLNRTITTNEEKSGLTTKWWLGTKSGYGDLFDAVFIAVPWHSSGITLMNTQSVIPIYDYVHLHVTILVTTAKQPDPTYFGRGKGDSIPTSILTSHISIRKAEEQRKKDEKKKEEGGGQKKAGKRGWWPGKGDGAAKGPLLEFNSLSYLESIDSKEEGNDKEHIVKLFSTSELSDAKLEDIFGQGEVKWVHRKQWDAYPCKSWFL